MGSTHQMTVNVANMIILLQFSYLCAKKQQLACPPRPPEHYLYMGGISTKLPEKKKKTKRNLFDFITSPPVHNHHHGYCYGYTFGYENGPRVPLYRKISVCLKVFLVVVVFFFPIGLIREHTANATRESKNNVLTLVRHVAMFCFIASAQARSI